MALLFLDASVLAKRYLVESGSDTMHAIVGAAEFRGRLVVAEHVEGEVLSLLNKCYRRGRLDRKGLRAARREFYTHFPSIFAVVPPLGPVLDDARAILNRYARHDIHYPDAMHLAAARYVAVGIDDPDLTFLSSDGALLAVAARLRIPTFDPERGRLADLK